MSKLCLCGALVAAVVLALLGAATRADATLPGANGRIAFESGARGASEIYTVDPDGSGVRQVTRGGDDYAPSWSPDGSTLVFHRITSTGFDMYAIGGDGSNERRLTATGDASMGTWAPDGSRIAFTRSIGPNGEMDIFTMSPDGSNVVNVTNHPASEDMPSWSPDGRRIAFQSQRTLVAFQIYTSNPDGSGVRQLTTDDQGNNESPDWSPDGSRVAFMSNRSGTNQIWVMNADGSAQRQVTAEVFDAEVPTWSPDGTKLLYTSWAPATGVDIVIANPDGTGRTVLEAGLTGPFPHWQPLGGVPARPAYAFAGFFAPVENQPTVNVANPGRAIPVKFSLGGDRGLDVLAPGSPSSQRVTCDTGAPLSSVNETVAANASGLSYDAATGRYQYVWKTEAAWAGTCRELDVRLADGTSHRATFRFK
ncbi:MAG: hypothetical protein QOF50_903 [Gaiellaceae bacterium]|jgi:dipeptidyl aminopeptidase/acylaminoacyl peptidase|nr:hypothetical protein [Gaiellaceae bacterium]